MKAIENNAEDSCRDMYTYIHFSNSWYDIMEVDGVILLLLKKELFFSLSLSPSSFGCYCGHSVQFIATHFTDNFHETYTPVSNHKIAADAVSAWEGTLFQV